MIFYGVECLTANQTFFKDSLKYQTHGLKIYKGKWNLFKRHIRKFMFKYLPDRWLNQRMKLLYL